MIRNKRGGDYLAVLKLPALLRRVTSRNNGDFNCLNCFYSFKTENKLKSHVKVCKNRFLWIYNAISRR